MRSHTGSLRCAAGTATRSHTGSLRCAAGTATRSHTGSVNAMCRRHRYAIAYWFCKRDRIPVLCDVPQAPLRDRNMGCSSVRQCNSFLTPFPTKTTLTTFTTFTTL
ncbi:MULTISPECIES: hypothetical protein [unclassified Moorena]|uniref:hypothetical protein n=1 Tax=unclassified Moorena TaxID=2683338 RepID=UPI0013B64FD0|nr:MULTISPECIES: hypothetical protein [unclassified Moorena]NEQ15685.1 hypothetical protein [Moorena sp. SIO3E2]NEP35444.1 hypothetical protein [Moorena sp. SIO3B2]NEP66909.1 hypothetical protein [Moorena sp. SIO3A5]NEQ10293.1 hypothetical protein [Moorena sp. SIO4E2]NER88667.1 hypothetical protein [Moorena sp. SIO3A2]